MGAEMELERQALKVGLVWFGLVRFGEEVMKPLGAGTEKR